MGQPELAEDPRFINNTKRCEYYLSDLKGIISAWTEQYTVAELEEMIVEARIPVDGLAVSPAPLKMHGVEDRCSVHRTPVYGV